MKLAPLLLAATLPLCAQWDLRLEIPRPKGQNLPQTLLAGSGELVAGDFDTGKGFIASVNRELFVFGPILRLEGGVEYARWTADGTLTALGPGGVKPAGASLTQEGLGVCLNAQMWIPFTGVAGEIGVIERFQRYKTAAASAGQSKDLTRPWLRVGARWRLPLPVMRPYLAASYQQPITKDRPVQVGSVNDLQTYMNAQGNGQEFERMWTFGVGVAF